MYLFYWSDLSSLIRKYIRLGFLACSSQTSAIWTTPANLACLFILLNINQWLAVTKQSALYLTRKLFGSWTWPTYNKTFLLPRLTTHDIRRFIGAKTKLSQHVAPLRPVCVIITLLCSFELKVWLLSVTKYVFCMYTYFLEFSMAFCTF